MSLLKKNEEEKRRELVGGSFVMGCFLAFGSYTVHLHEPQRPLKAVACGVVALLFFGLSFYNMRRKPSDPGALPAQITEIEQRSLLFRWPLTLVSLFLFTGTIFDLAAHRPQDASMAGIVALVTGVGATQAWQIWLRRR
ncbi:MAG: hypothetical protein JO250_23345 [Armatimonadetes bacterium]|nr:hypothetical protein [Armatimonadota bacterium]